MRLYFLLVLRSVDIKMVIGHRGFVYACHMYITNQHELDASVTKNEKMKKSPLLSAASTCPTSTLRKHLCVCIISIQIPASHHSCIAVSLPVDKSAKPYSNMHMIDPLQDGPHTPPSLPQYDY